MDLLRKQEQYIINPVNNRDAIINNNKSLNTRKTINNNINYQTNRTESRVDKSPNLNGLSNTRITINGIDTSKRVN